MSLEKDGRKFWINWIVDSNHPRRHAAYKNLTRLSKDMPDHVKLVTQDGYSDSYVSYYKTGYASNITRTGNSFNVFKFNPKYKEQILSFFDK